MSLAVCDKTPAKTTTTVKSFFGDEITKSLKLVRIKPLASAIAKPSSAVKTVPSGAKLIKFVTKPVKIRCKPSTDSRLTARIVSFVAGC